MTNGRLVTAAGCLVEHDNATTVREWGGEADRVVVDNTVLVAGSSPIELGGDGQLVLSRPKGTAVLRLTPDGKLLKREILGETWRDISFMAHHEFAAYHPAGHHVVSSGTNEEGGAELMIADNEGRDPRRLLTIEDANHVGNPTFTADGALLYVADHEGHVDLHLLNLGDDAFSTLATVTDPGGITDVTASPFANGGVAWTEGRCTATESPVLKVRPGTASLSVAGTDAEHTRPVGWLPDGGLVLIDQEDCAPSARGTLSVLRGATSGVLASNVSSAAVRAVLPPPAEPPRQIPQQAPA